MSSPPPPPVPLNLPKKRASVSSVASSQPSKKRQTTHPLRQTSFPAPDASAFVATPSSAYARSETGSVASGYSRATTSLADGMGGKRGRGRPRKSDITAASASGQGGADDALSVSRGGEGSLVNGQPGNAKGGGAGGEGAEQEDDEDDEFGEVEGDWAEWEEREAKLMEILIRTFNPEQEARYSAYKRTKFKESILKRIVNQIVSQSVTKAPLIAVNAYTKYFTGEIIERARDVQEEYAKAYDKVLEEKWREHDREEAEKNNKQAEEEEKKRQTGQSDVYVKKEESSPKATTSPAVPPPTTTTPPPTSTPNVPSPTTTTNPSTVRPLPPPPHPLTTLSGFENPHRGGLLPDHLREALRRYKQSGEGGGVGFDGMSLGGLGVKGRRTWGVGGSFGGGGRRLFR